MARGRELFRYCATRLALAPLMLWLIASLVFLLLRVAPGDPVDAVLGSRAPEAAKAALRASLGLDQSLWHQYSNFLGGLVHGDLAFEPFQRRAGAVVPLHLQLQQGVLGFDPRLQRSGRLA